MRASVRLVRDRAVRLCRRRWSGYLLEDTITRVRGALYGHREAGIAPRREVESIDGEDRRIGRRASGGWNGSGSGSTAGGDATAASTAESSNSRRRPDANNLRSRRANSAGRLGSPLPRAAMMRSPSSRATDRKIRRRSGDRLPRRRVATVRPREPRRRVDGCDESAVP